MKELEKILEEIDQEVKEYMEIDFGDEYNAGAKDMAKMARKIIRKHMNDGWIPVERELPPNAKYKGALCPRYQLDTKYGVTEGWYNPFLESWYVLLWFMTKRYLDSEIDLKRGGCPNVVQVRNEVNVKYNVVLAWRPFPEPYRPERSSDEKE